MEQSIDDVLTVNRQVNTQSIMEDHINLSNSGLPPISVTCVS